MPLAARDFEKLKEMQRLCSEVEADAGALQDFVASLEALQQRYTRLSELYQADWLRIVESNKMDEAQQNAIEAMVKAGSYSIFGQDTIWNALSDVRQWQMSLLKKIAAHLE